MTEADTTTDALVRDWVRICGVLGNKSVVEVGNGASLCATGIPVATLNCVFTTREDAAPSDVEKILDAIHGKGLPYCVQIRPGCSDQLAEAARERGLSAHGSIPLMRLDAGAVDVARDAAHPDLRIRQLSSDERHLHIAIASEGFEVPPALFEEMMTQAVFALPGFHSYVGSAGGEPVTTAVAMVESEHVGIYNVATAKAWRGRGYGAAITARGVLDGFRAGASFALLQSSDPGFGVYERLGFRTVENWDLWISN